MVVYQIYPLSFKDSDDDGKGDLKGIIEKLDYLHDGETSLRVDAIWLSPVYKSPMKDFGYDVSDFCSIDPSFGTMETFETLVKEIHKRDMKIIIDFVANHTSGEHPWFLESKSSKNNPKRDWYVWKNPKQDGTPPNNWISVFGGPAWTLDETTGQYYLHNFLKEQPDLNWRNPEVDKAMREILEFWIQKGVDGFRVDAMQYFLEDGYFRDDPINPDYSPGKDDPYKSLIHTHSKGTETCAENKFLIDLIDNHSDKNLFVVSESYSGIEEMKCMYQSCPRINYMPFNFNLIGLPWVASSYKKFLDEYEASLLPHEGPNYVLGNHDLARIATRLGLGRARLSAFLQLTLRGEVFIYNGEELGMTNAVVTKECVLDQVEINIPGLGLGRDPERAPMHWSSESYAGFSKAKPWLPIGENYKEVNFESESKDPHSILSMYRTLIKLRHSSHAFSTGEYVPLTSGMEDVLSFGRRGEDGTYLVLINFSDMEVVEKVHREGTVVTNSNLDRPIGEKISDTITLKPLEGIIIKT